MSEVMSVADILDAAADLIEPAGAWTQGCGSRDADGLDLDDADPGEGGPAVCFCVGEAIYQVNRLSLGMNPAHQYLIRFLNSGVIRWNDAPERTQPEVVAKLREAAALAREQSR